MSDDKPHESGADGFVPSPRRRIWKFWKQLRAKRFDGFKFRRQHRIGPYFADLCCVEWHLIIELDGSQHAEPEKEQKDAARTVYLSKQGYRVVRLWNEQVNRELEDVLETIYQALTDS